MKFSEYIFAFKRLWNQLDSISKNNKISKLHLLLNSALCYILYGSTPNDYVHFEFYKLNHNERKKFITRRKTLKLDKIFNNPKNMKYFDNKVEFNKKFRDFVKREWIYLPEVTYIQFEAFIKKHKTVIIKPIDLSSGKGIESFTFKNDKDLQVFYSNNKNKKILIEEKVINHDDIRAFNPSSANTIRIYTIVEKDGNISIINAIIRIGASGSCVDNFHSGGVIAAIDLNTGIICTIPVDVNGKRHILHPSSHQEILGKKIPMWDELIKNVKNAAKVLPDSRYIGWDICITPNGFEYIEGNYHSDPGVLQSADLKGKYYLLKSKI